MGDLITAPPNMRNRERGKVDREDSAIPNDIIKHHVIPTVFGRTVNV